MVGRERRELKNRLRRDPPASAANGRPNRRGAARAGARASRTQRRHIRDAAAGQSQSPPPDGRAWCWRPIPTRSRMRSTRPVCRWAAFQSIAPMPPMTCWPRPICPMQECSMPLASSLIAIPISGISPMNPGALDGILVIDLTRVLGRAVLHPDPGRSRRRDRQDRAAPGRRGARLGAALQRGAGRLLFRRRQPQQALARPRSGEAPGPRGAAPAARARRRPDRELQARRHGAVGPRLPRRCSPRASRAWSIAGSAASAPTGRWAAIRATTPWSRRWSACSRSTACPRTSSRTAGRPGSASRWSISAPDSTPRSRC